MIRSEAELRRFYERRVEADAPKLAVTQRLTPEAEEPTFEGADALSIVYCVSSSNFPSDKSLYVADMAAATRAWEDVSNVRFVYDPAQDDTCDENNSLVDFAVKLLTFPSALVGCAQNKLLWEGVDVCLGSGTLGVQSHAVVQNLPDEFADLTMAGLMRHELGHILGFRHEHPWSPDPQVSGCDEGTQNVDSGTGFRRLTDYDQASVMHYPQCNGIVQDFTITDTDGKGARQIYGMPASWYVAADLI
jgi:hypothetical protein